MKITRLERQMLIKAGQQVLKDVGDDWKVSEYRALQAGVEKLTQQAGGAVPDQLEIKG